MVISKETLVYKATINRKSYIGISSNFKRRKMRHIWEAKNKPKYYFHKAISKYGESNIIWEVLHECGSFEEAKLLEQFNIILYDSYKNGYNMTLGGDGQLGVTSKGRNKGRKASKESKQKMSKAHIGKVNGPHRDITKQKMSKASTGKPKSKKHIESLKSAQQLRWSNLEARRSAAKRNGERWFDVLKDGVLIKSYMCMSECAKELKVHAPNIWKCLNGKYKTTGGYAFKYKEGYHGNK